MVPHLAEEAWAALGRDGLIADAAWPEADPALLVEDEVTIAVQVNGKLRDTLTAPKGAPQETLEEMALASEKVRADPRRQRAAQGDRRARPAGEHRRMRRARRSSPAALLRSPGCGAAAALRAAAAAGAVAQTLRGGRRSRRSRAGPAGWCAPRSRTGSAAARRRRAALPARGRARRRHYRLRHPLATMR